MNPLVFFTLGFIAGALVVALMVYARQLWLADPDTDPDAISNAYSHAALPEPREKKLLLEVPFLDGRMLDAISLVVLGPNTDCWPRDPVLQPDERVRLAITIERFVPTGPIVRLPE